MKTSLISLGLLITTSVFAAPPFQNVTWNLAWDQPTNMPVLASYVPGTNQAYKIYGTSTLGTPQAQWPLLSTVTSWTLTTNSIGAISLNTSVTTPFAPQYFFYVNPTNSAWGEPPFSLNYWSWVMSGPVWSTVNNSSLNRQSP